MNASTAASELHWWTARDLAAAIRTRQLSAEETMRVFLDRIHALEPELHAFLHRVPEDQALQAARRADEAVARGEPLGPLHGLPIAMKDLMDVEGLPTTCGSLVHAGRIAAKDCLLAERLRRAGALIIGKTNTPEQGLGTVTFNALGAPTRNPWDLARHAGGSSGGAAAAVAAGMLPIADGSDSGGSIRYPASFCNLVGLRPSAGLVPTARVADGWSPHALLGPMARNARDAGLLLSAIAGRDPRAPLSFDVDASVFANIQPLALRGVRLAWSPTLGGLPIEPAVTAVLESALAQLERLGCTVETVDLDLHDADRCWEVIEMHEFMASCAADADEYAARLRPDLVENVRIGRSQTAEQIAWAQVARTELYRRTARLLGSFDFLLAPATPVFAPPIESEWVREIDGHVHERYFGWQRCACRVTALAHPAMAIPAGFSAQGWPVGLQVIGPDRGDLALLRFAAAVEDATGYASRHPEVSGRHTQ